MAGPAPHNFEFPRYLQRVLGISHINGSLYVATEKDFARGGNITYPYRSHFYALGILHKGSCRLRVGIRDYDLTERCITMVGPGIVRQWLENDWTAVNHTFFFTPELFTTYAANNLLANYAFFKPGATHVIKLLEDDYQKILQFISIIEQHQSKGTVVQGLLFAMLEYISSIYNVVAGGVDNNTRNERISNQFAGLLHQHYQQEKDLGFYAGKLNISAKHLSDVLKKQTGLTAKQSIEQFVMQEAKSLLKQTDLSIKEIVYLLGYEDPSYFTKLFRSKAGVTPQDYRLR